MSLKLNLSDPALLREDAYIDGHWEAQNNRFDVTDPATGSLIARVANLGGEDVNRAIDAAKKAQTDWARRTAKERSDLIRAWADLMMAAQDDLGLILTSEMSKPLAEAKDEIAAT